MATPKIEYHADPAVDAVKALLSLGWLVVGYRWHDLGIRFIQATVTMVHPTGYGDLEIKGGLDLLELAKMHMQ